MEQFVYGLPKTDLHVHVEGVMEPPQILEFAARNGVKLPYDTVDGVKKRMGEAVDLPTFIAVRTEMLSVMRTEQDFYETAYSYFRISAQQNVVYVEMFFDPQCHTARGVSFDTVMAGLTRAQRDAQKQLGVRSQLVMCFNRDLSADSAMATLEASAKYKDQIVGVGLDNPEVEGFTDKFKAVFARAKAMGYRLTSHCDVDQKESLRNIRGALDTLGVERIDHGVNILEDPALVREALQRGIGFTACPSLLYDRAPDRFNFSYFKRVSSLVKPMLEQKLLVTLGTDDPGMFVSQYNADVYLAAQEQMNLSRADMVTLARNGFRIAWISDADKAAYQARVDAYVAKFPALAQP